LALCGNYAAGQMQILDGAYEALEQPLSPQTPLPEDVQVSARFVYHWSLSDGSRGQFQLTIADRKLTARDAVIWLEPLDKADHWTAKKLDIFMQGDARLVETTGAVTSDEILYVTVQTAGRLGLEAMSVVREDGSGQEIYRRALALRGRSTTGVPAAQVPPHGAVKVHAPEQTSREQKAQDVRFPITIRGDFAVRRQPDGSTVLIVTNGVYLFQAAAEGQEPLELRAQNAVLFIKPQALKRPDKAAAATMPATLPSATNPAQQAQMLQRLEQLPTEDSQAVPLIAQRQEVARDVSAGYLEGDVVLIRGYRQIRAQKVYYDFDNARALLIDVVARTVEPQRNVPIYIRASQVRQLSQREFVAKNAKISTSEFYRPSYYVGATTVHFQDQTQRLESGETVGLAAGTYQTYNTTLNVEGLPILYWPYTAGRFKESETSLRSVRASYSSDFGTTAQTRWYLMNLLGLEQPEGVDATVKLDYYGDRGPAAGIDIDYRRDTYFGLLRTYFVHDKGKDHLGGGRPDVEPPHSSRGRALLRHRHYLPDRWELTLELSYLSDANFLEEYFKSEFDEDKAQETLIYLKKTFGDAIFSVLGQWRLMSFLTQTEHMPEVVLDVPGRALFDGRVTWYSENRVGAVRYRPDNRRFFDKIRIDNTGKTDATARGETRQEFEIPAELGPLKLVGFGAIRGSAWDSRPFYSGNIGRVLGTYGLRGSLYQWKVIDGIDMRFWDLHRLRHIMKEDFVVWASHSNVDSWELTPFDQGIETIDEIDGVSVGWRHRLQTKRGGPGNWQTVDFLTLDLELGFFNDSQDYDGRNRTRGQTFFSRPENSISSNYASLRSAWRVSDTAAILYDLVVDTDRGAIGSSGLGLHVDRDPRLSYFLGHRYVGLSDSNLFGFGANYRLNEKYTMAFREEYDINRGANADIAITIIRHMPRWFLAFTVEFDQVEDVDSVSISIWPEGIPEWTIGPRRYTSLATSTALRP